MSWDLLETFLASFSKSLIRLSGVNCSQGRSVVGAVSASSINSVELFVKSPFCSLLKEIRICRIEIASAPANSLLSNSSI